MTKKHFEALAAALKATSPDRHDEECTRVNDRMARAECVCQWQQDVDALADVCARFNPNFDRARFLAACGVEG
jgi:hypothetical protein